MYSSKSAGTWWDKELALENKSMYHFLHPGNLSKKKKSQLDLNVLCNEIDIHPDAFFLPCCTPVANSSQPWKPSED